MLRAGCAPLPSSVRNGASRNTPRSTTCTLSISTPSSPMSRESEGMEPGVMPPMSAWWPRAATKNCGEAASPRNTGMTTVTSGRWVPPA